MSTESTLLQRSDSKCELCGNTDNIQVYAVEPGDGSADQSAMLCETCRQQLEAAAELDVNHWRCLNDSMWSPVAAVQVLAWRQLNTLEQAGQTWARELLDMMYMEDEVRAWAEALQPETADSDAEPTRDSNGAILQAGDTVTLIKDLDVKGAGFTAKRGTAVRNISLTDNPEHIEGRVNGVRVVLLSCFLKKS